jgi:hypothetical protein
MAGLKLQKRDDDFFVSYGHRDFERVASVVGLLKRTCGFRIWFDGTDANASLRSSELLSGAIGNARGALFFLSEAWTRSTWCKNEFEVSLSEQRMHDGFEIICLRLDDAEPPGWFNVAEIIDLRVPGSATIGRLLRSLSSDVPHRFDNSEDVYLAAPWSRPASGSSASAKPAWNCWRIFSTISGPILLLISSAESDEKCQVFSSHTFFL